jgi:O-antigen/teichoic acid export membrane protein
VNVVLFGSVMDMKAALRTTSQIRDPQRNPRSPVDLTGRRKLLQNAIASWSGHAVFLVAGFIMPRYIDRHMSQEVLGIWDFGWSLVGYFGFLGGGVLSSIAPYVARYRMSNRPEEVNVTVSSGFAFFLFSASIVLISTLIIGMVLPSFMSDRFATHVREAQLVVLFLGFGVVFQFVFSVFGGVVTGCHRWGVHNLISSGVHALTVGGMVLAIYLGNGLPTLAAITMFGDILSGILHMLAAFLCCNGLRITPQLVRRERAVELIWFGGKSMLELLSFILMYQTTSLRALVNKFAFLFSPIAGAINGMPKQDSLRELLPKAAKYSLYISLPMVLTLVILGNPILRLWMGARYENEMLISILALGHLALHSQLSTYQMLRGLGRHGWPGFISLMAALLAIALAIVGLGPLKLGLSGAALAVVVPSSIVWGIIIPSHACRIVGLSYWQFLFKSVPGPVLACIPFTICLIISRIVFGQKPLVALLAGLSVGSIVLGIVYFRLVLPSNMRARVLARVSDKLKGKESVNAWNSGSR